MNNSDIRHASAHLISKYLDDLLRITENLVTGCTEGEKEIYWKELYNVVFSDKISKTIFSRFPDFHYTDPDTSYQEDVCAFICAFREYSDNPEIKKEYDELPSFDTWMWNLVTDLAS